jgi:predicted dehydrogenase
MTIESLSHDIDMIRWLFGEITEVRAVLRESRADLPGYDDNVCAVLRTDRDLMATIHASWSSALGRGSRGVVGSGGSIALEGPDVWTISGVRWRTKDADHEKAESFTDTLGPDSYRACDADFLASLADGRPRAPTARDGLAALSVSLAMIESSRTGLSVAVRR